MVIWSGKGILSILVFIVACVISLKVLPEAHMDLSLVLGCFVSGAFSWMFGKKWNNAQRIVIDEETGKQIALRGNHSIFFIKMQYWGIVFFALGGILLFQDFTKVLRHSEAHNSGFELWGRLIVLIFCLLLLIISLKRKPQRKIKELQIVENKPFNSPEKEIEKNEDSSSWPIRSIDKEEHSRFMPKTTP